MRRPLPLLCALLPLLWLVACGGRMSTARVDGLLGGARNALAPDPRTRVFGVTGTLRGGELILGGEIHSAEMKAQLLRYLREHSTYLLVDRIQALPAPGVVDRPWALVSVSVANLRAKPEHLAELKTQALMGTVLRVLKEEEGWLLVQTPDDYLGWTEDRAVRYSPAQYAAWCAAPKVIVTAHFTLAREAPSPSAPVVSDLVLGGVVRHQPAAGDWVRVGYPDGREAFVERSAVEPLDEWLARARATAETVLPTARMLMGVPYLWGGTSVKGLDCSGLIRTVFFMNGVVLPRDASQQILAGDPVDPAAGHAALQAGDLLFFGRPALDGKPERITHVALYLGNDRYIHAWGDVRLNSFDPQAPDYSAYRARTYVRATRVIGRGEDKGVRRAADLPGYRPVATTPPVTAR